MYNKVVKENYLHYLGNDITKIRNAEHIFQYVEELEQVNETDLCDIPYDAALIYLLQTSRITSFATFRAHYYAIKNYKTWALINDFVADYAKAYIDERVNLKEIFLKNNTVNLFRTPADLAYYLHAKLNKRNDDNRLITIDQISTAYVMLIYQGLTPDEVLNIKVQDIVFTNNNMVVITNDKAIIIYPEFAEDIAVVAKRRSYLHEFANIKEIIELEDLLIDNGRNNMLRQKRANFASILSSRQARIKIKDVYYMGKLYDFAQHHENDISNYNKKEIFQWCFNGNQMTKTKREQFYRFVELWIS